jgi:hypothetical protein
MQLIAFYGGLILGACAGISIMALVSLILDRVKVRS